MGIGFALTEDFTPYYPSMEHTPDNLSDYTIATAADMPREMVWDIVEVPIPTARGSQGLFRR